MNIYKCLSSAAFLCAAVAGFAQSNVTGRVTDEAGKPLAGVAVSVPGTTISTITDADGKYAIAAPAADSQLSFVFIGCKSATASVNGSSTVDVVLVADAKPFTDIFVKGEYCKDISLAENVASVSVISEDDFSHRTDKNIGNTLFGQGLGLTTLQGSGHYADYQPTFYVRGLKTLQNFGSKPLILVDGVERPIEDVSQYEVESVTVLKDAAALALYGYKGVNGAINIRTKRGEYNTQKIDVSYQHSFDRQMNMPEFVDAATYAKAYNEALVNDGKTAYYTPEAIEAFEKGTSPELFPNVDWQKETFRDWGHTNNINVTFQGGSKKFRYFTMLNLNGHRGFNKLGEDNPDYKTQDQYSRGTIRSNIDIDLTDYTKVNLNILAALSEARHTGSDFAWGSSNASYSFMSAWNAIYSVSSAAFPVKVGKYWGGAVDSNYAPKGTNNPVAISAGAGYLKNHDRGIFVDFAIDQDLSIFVEGLGAQFRLAYDNKAYYLENYSKVYDYAFYDNKGGSALTYDAEGNVVLPKLSVSADENGNSIETSLSTNANIWNYNRAVKVFGNVYYDTTISDNQSLYAQIRYDFEKRDSRAVNSTFYYQNLAGYLHYVLNNRYIVDGTFVGSANNFLAPGHKWNFSPTVALGWIVSNEDFMDGSDVVDFLKLRASFGRINSANVPGNGFWVETYGAGPSYYMFDSKYTDGSASTMLGSTIPSSIGAEKANKFNVAVEAKLFNSLSLTLEAFKEIRKDIWVSAAGRYSDVFGLPSPYENGGEVLSGGFEAGLDFTKKFGDVVLNVGGNFTYNTSEIKEQYEELKAYDNLKTTGHRVGQLFGMKSIGFFTDQADIDASAPQLFTTVVPGDIKYEDVNRDGQIDANDATAIGYNNICPEIYYSFHLGAEYKGLGFDVAFQGAANYSTYLSTTGVYKPLVGNANLSTEYFENRWTPENAESALYPRLSLLDNANNNRQNTTFVQDRSFLKLRNVDIYYNLPASVFEGQKAIKGAKVFLRGRDLACFTNVEAVDPENTGVGYPLTSSFTAGLSINF